MSGNWLIPFTPDMGSILGSHVNLEWRKRQGAYEEAVHCG